MTRGGAEVEIVGRAYEAWNMRDEDALLALLAEDVEIHSALARSEGGGGVYHGRDGAATWLRNNTETVAFVMEPKQYLSHRHHVLSLVIARVHGVESGLSLPQEYGLVHEVRDGQIARVFSYTDPADAIEAMARLTRS